MPATDSPGGGPGSLRRGVGELEAEVLGVLRAAGQALSPGDVRERLEVRDGRALSYSTVVTIVSRLHAKGLLSRQRAGRGFTYQPVDDASLAAGRMRVALAAEADHGAVLSRFVSGLSDRDAMVLRELLGTDDQPAGGPADPGE